MVRIESPPIRISLAMTTAILATLGVLALPASSLASSAPVIELPSATVTEDGATLEAQIRPEGLETRYEFWLRYPMCRPGAGGETCAPEAVGQVGGGDVSAGRLEGPVSVGLTSLHPSHLRILVERVELRRHERERSAPVHDPTPFCRCPGRDRRRPAGRRRRGTLESGRGKKGGRRSAATASRTGSQEEEGRGRTHGPAAT
jgi:hypothetical protein